MKEINEAKEIDKSSKIREMKEVSTRNILTALNEWRLYIETFLKWLIVGSLIGGTSGILGAVFHHGIIIAEEFRRGHERIIWLLPIAGVIIACFYHITKTEGVNTNNVIRAVHKGRRLPVLLLPAIFVGTILTHLCGGSAGREGAALQMGGTIGQWIGKGLHLEDSDVRIATLAGMAGFFSALFGTPLAASVFAVMVISVGVLYHAALVPCLISALSAYFIATAMDVEPIRFSVLMPELEALTMGKVAVLAILCALVSVLFCACIHTAEKFMAKLFPNTKLRAFVGGTAVIAMTYLAGSTDCNGVGMGIITAAVENGEAEPLAFLLKILFTAVTLAAGFKGGEIVPSFFAGATFGCVIAPFLGLPANFGAAIGLVAVFCGVTNCPISSIFLSIELFGSEGMIYFAAACCLSYMMSGYHGIYSSQMIMYSKRKAKFINAYTNGKKGSDA